MTEDELRYSMELGERISLSRGNRTQVLFAKELGVNKNTLLGYEKGRVIPDILTVRKICDKGPVNWDWLVSGEGPMRPGEAQEQLSCPACIEREVVRDPQPCFIDENGVVSIPRWQNPDPEMFDYIPMAETRLSAGGGCFVLSENMEDYYAFRKNWLSRVASSPNKLVLMRINGNSMSPTLEDGDTVMIDTGRRDIKEGMIYALRVDHSVMIKRLSFRVGGKVLIISDNRHDYDPYEAPMKDVHILGQVIFFCRTFVAE